MGDRKRPSGNLDTLETDPIKKRLRTYQAKVSLLDLNDDCLLTIFEKLNNIDLCHVQNTCTRFDPLAESTFYKLLKRNPDWAKFTMDSVTSSARRVFYKFGHLFRTFHVLCEIDYRILERLTQLESLTLEHSEVSGDSSKLLREKHSPLQRLTFNVNLPPLSTFSDFLECNQQLQCLGLPVCTPPDYITCILKHAQQLTELYFYSPRHQHKLMSPEMFNLLLNLKDLRKLTITGILSKRRNSAKLLLLRTPELLTHLELKDFIVKKPTLALISAMKSLQHVALMGMFDCLKTEIVSMVASLPLLNSFTLLFESCGSPSCRSRNLSFNTVKGIVEAGKELNMLKLVDVREMRIDGKGYAQLLDILRNRQHRLSIAIKGCSLTTTFDVPTYVQRGNDQCLRVDYSPDGRCSCKAGN